MTCHGNRDSNSISLYTYDITTQRAIRHSQSFLRKLVWRAIDDISYNLTMCWRIETAFKVENKRWKSNNDSFGGEWVKCGISWQWQNENINKQLRKKRKPKYSDLQTKFYSVWLEFKLETHFRSTCQHPYHVNGTNEMAIGINAPMSPPSPGEQFEEKFLPQYVRVF